MLVGIGLSILNGHDTQLLIVFSDKTYFFVSYLLIDLNLNVANCFLPPFIGVDDLRLI